MLSFKAAKFWLVGVALFAVTATAPAPKAQAVGTYTAYSVGVAFWTQVWPLGNWNPHYGAFFSGMYGMGYTFTCGSGPATPDWWGTSYNVAILEKRWYWSTPSSQYPSCHQAVMQY